MTLFGKETPYTIVGLTHTLFEHITPREAQTDAVERFVKENVEPGITTLTLTNEPDNPKDTGAIAAYLLRDEYQKIGYLTHKLCETVKPLMDSSGQYEVKVVGWDGHITLYVDIPNAPKFDPKALDEKRVLPENPLKDVLRMAYSEDERLGQMLANKLLKLESTVENAGMILCLARQYVPLSQHSICYEDSLFRHHILDLLNRTREQEVDDSTRKGLDEQRQALTQVISDQATIGNRPMLKVMKAQMEEIRKQEEMGGIVLERFADYLKGSKNSEDEELEKLRDWFRSMPDPRLFDWRDYDNLSEGICYKRVPRKELYEVYASILVLEEYTQAPSAIPDFNPIREYVGQLKGILSSPWSEGERYMQLWDSVLQLPCVNSKVMDKGKQKGTTFNRNLVANILHLMMDRGMFTTTKASKLAEMLEKDANHSVRSSLGSMPDRQIKDAVTGIIDAHLGMQ